MPKPISILFVATEAEPFISTGSIGDVAGNLPKNVKALGHDIRVMLPGYSLISNRRFQIHNLLRMKDIDIPLGSNSERAYVKSSYLNSENHKVLVYFLANERYFNREGLYFHPLTKSISLIMMSGSSSFVVAFSKRSNVYSGNPILYIAMIGNAV